MGLFNGKETKEEKQKRKEAELLEKYGLSNVDEKDIQSINKEIERLTELSKELNEDLSTYIKLYGVESFNNN